MKRFALLSVCLLALLAGSAFAQDPPPNPPQTAPAAGKRQGRMNAKKLQQMDANSDGKITREEWQGRAKGFDRLDANGDGALTREELSSASGQQLKQLDANSDGKIARDEWKGKPKAFDKLDTNGDGFLTTDELQKRRGKRQSAPPATSPANPPVKPAF